MKKTLTSLEEAFLSTPSARRATGFLVDIKTELEEFLSTPSARRATPRPRLYGQRLHISIHALREEGDRGQGAARLLRPISIHALREEGDRKGRDRRAQHQHFYPRPPRGGRRSGPESPRRQ